MSLFFYPIYSNSYRCATVAAGIYCFLIIFIFYIPLSLVFLQPHTYAKHLYVLSGHSTLTLMSPGMRVKWTIKGIGYLQQLDHRHAHMHTHRTRPAVQQRVKEAHVYSSTEGARYCHEESWPSEGAGDRMWKITGKTSVSEKSYDFWLRSLDQSKGGSNVKQIKEWGWEWKEKGSSIKCIS